MILYEGKLLSDNVTIHDIRKSVLKAVDRDELEAFDQFVELVSLVVGSILILISIIGVIVEVPPIALLAQITNVVFTVIFWLGYKIARAKLSIDLRFWIIVEGVTFAYFILIHSVIQISTTFSLDLPPLIFTGLFILLWFLIDPIRSFTVSYVAGRWDRIRNDVDDDSRPDSLDLNALYLLKDAQPDSMAYAAVGVPFAIVILSVYTNPANLGAYIFPAIILPLVLVYLLWKIKRSQERLLNSDIIFENSGS